jgi:hypothetical protein
LNQRQLVGTWELIACEFRHRDGSVSHPLGARAAGRLNYDAGGRMAVQLMRRGRPPLPGGHDLTGPDEDVRAAFTGYLAYFGTYEVDEAAGAVTHRVEGSLLPNWVGTPQERFVAVEGDRLVLRSAPFESHGAKVTAYLEWRRLS